MSTGAAPNTQGVYSPLPFSDTDSSEEEVFNKNTIQLAEKHVVNRKITSPEHSQSTRNGKTMASTESSLIAEYRPLSNSETSLNGFGERGRLVLLPSSPTAIVEEAKPVEISLSISRDAKKGWSSMSPIRKACFVGSIFMCIFTIVGFLWILPCDLESSCSKSADTPLDHAHLASSGSWESVLEGIELTGAPSLAQGRLVFTVRGPQPLVRSLTPGEPRWNTLGYGPFLPDRASAGQAGGGALALWPDTGAISWTLVTPGAAPRAAKCDLLDATGDGRHDCLIANPDWLLAALDPATGILLWYLHIHRDNSTQISRNSSRRTFLPPQKKPARIRFPPLKVRDVDGDGVPDLCALCSPQLSSSLDSFVLVSGKRGNVIGQLVNVSGCVSLTGLELEEADSTLSFTCINQAGAESVRIMPVEELYLRAVNRSQQDPALLPPLHKRQQPPREVYEQGINDGRTYSLEVRGHKLSVDNRGTCPRCRSLVVLSDTHNNTIWSYQGRGERSMAPLTLQFSGITPHRGTATGTTSSLSGFVLKFWQWPAPPQRTGGTKVPDAKPVRSMRRRAVLRDNTQWDTDHSGVEEGSSAGTPQVKVNQLKERVLIITFNTTDIHVINASQSEVAQLCAIPLPPSSQMQRYAVKEPICQPELVTQQNSLLIADLDEDGTQELVSFTSTYVPVQEADTVSSTSKPINSATNPTITWELISKIKAIHLETELSKLA